MTTERPWMPLYVADYMLDTRHLTVEQHGVYLLLLMNAWRRKNCALPDDPSLLKSMLPPMHRRTYDRIVPAVLLMFFVLESDGFWHHKRLETERENARKIGEKQKQNSRKRWEKTRENGNGIDNKEKISAMAMPARASLHSHREASASLSVSSSNEKDTGASAVPESDPIGDPDKYLFDEGKRVLGPKAGGVITDLKKALNGNVWQAIAVIKTAEKKSSPMEYVQGTIRRRNAPTEDAPFGYDKDGRPKLWADGF